MSLHETSPILFLCVDLADFAPSREDDTCMLRRQYGSRRGAKGAEVTQRKLFFTGYHRLGKALLPPDSTSAKGRRLGSSAFPRWRTVLPYFSLRDLADFAPSREDDTRLLRRQYGSRRGAKGAEATQRKLFFTGYLRLLCQEDVADYLHPTPYGSLQANWGHPRLSRHIPL